MFIPGTLKSTSNNQAILNLKTWKILSRVPKLRGFTLIELLVVLAVMGVLMGMLGFTILGSGSDVYDGQRQLVSLLHRTRTTALGAGREARLIVCADSSDQEKYMRLSSIVVEDSNNSGNLKTWRVVEEGVFLPEGLWFVEKSNEDDSNWLADGYCFWSGGDDIDFNLDQIKNGSRSEGGTESVAYRFVAFNSSGSVLSEDFPKMPRLVISPGELRPNNGQLLPSFFNPSEVVGVELRPFGGILCLDTNDFSSDG